MINIDTQLTPSSLVEDLENVFDIAGKKILRLHERWQPNMGAPVFTEKGKYTSRGWTEWTQGFQFGLPLLQFDVTGDLQFLEIGKTATLDHMAPHLTHIGVHDHGFNNVSTYGVLLRLAREEKANLSLDLRRLCELALKVSGAVQAARWTKIDNGEGFIHSFNGPHSLFADTIRSLRALAVSHQLGHALMGEHDEKINLLERIVQHAFTTATYNVYFGQGRDQYDVRGRVAHESVFNLTDGRYRCPSSQQGYSPFTTWTRGHAWILCGYAEQLPWLASLEETEFELFTQSKSEVIERFVETATAAADFYLEQTPADGVPYWDTGAPGLAHLGDYLNRPSDPFNDHEPVDSSSAAIAAQGLLRLGIYLDHHGDDERAKIYRQAALTTARSLLQSPYLSNDEHHEGLLLHSIYHRPNGWDYIPKGSSIPHGRGVHVGRLSLAGVGSVPKTNGQRRAATRVFPSIVR